MDYGLIAETVAYIVARDNNSNNNQGLRPLPPGLTLRDRPRA